MPKSIREDSRQHEATQKYQDADQRPQADPGGTTAGGAQFGGAGMLMAVDFAAIPADGLGQALALIARRRFIILGNLRSPPARPHPADSQRLGTDPIRAQVSFGNRGLATGTVNGPVVGTKQLPAGKTAADGFLVTEVAIHRWFRPIPK